MVISKPEKGDDYSDLWNGNLYRQLIMHYIEMNTTMLLYIDSR